MSNQLSLKKSNAKQSVVANRIARAPRKAELRNCSDRALIRLVLAHEEEQAKAWAELMRRYKDTIDGAIFKVLRHFGPVLTSDAREEVTQDFYLSLFVDEGKRLRVFDPSRGKLSSWFYKIAEQQALNLTRKVLTRPRTVGMGALSYAENYAPEERGYDDDSHEPRPRIDVVDAKVAWLQQRAEQEAVRATSPRRWRRR